MNLIDLQRKTYKQRRIAGILHVQAPILADSCRAAVGVPRLWPTDFRAGSLCECCHNRESLL